MVFMIPDGCGPASYALARAWISQSLGLDAIVTGSCRTGAIDEPITDSAASATAYACGVKTRNGMVGVDPGGRRLTTLREAAERRGMATGLVVTSRMTHATPACFAAHVEDRNLEEQIALQEIEAGIEVLLGGGRDYFLPVSAGGRRKDGRDLLADAERKGATLVESPAELLGELKLPIIGLFTPDNMSYDIDRGPRAEPSLAEMSRRALELLAKDPDGFFLMIEGSRIDHAGHSNDPAAHVRDVIAYDQAVRVVLDIARRDGRTLVISVADHETGGLALGGGGNPESPETAFLRGVQASAERIASRIAGGEDAAAILRELAGIETLTAEERARLQALHDENRHALESAVAAILSKRAGVTWSTNGHTATDVTLHAFGPADRFQGVLENDEIGRRAAGIMHFDLGIP
jgi:alkaline phosphatase